MKIFGKVCTAILIFLICFFNPHLVLHIFNMVPEDFQVQADITSNLEGYWAMDDGTGNTVTDSSGNSRNGTKDSDVSWTATAKWGTALSFPGAANNDNAKFTTNSAFQPGDGQDFTIAAWLQRTSNISNSCIIGTRTNCATTVSATGYNLFVPANTSLLKFFVTDGSQSEEVQATLSSTGTWYHVVAVFDDDTGMYLYVNGSPVSNSTSISDINSMSTSNQFTMGTKANDNSEWNGILEDVRFYSRALSSSDVTELYNWTPSDVTVSSTGTQSSSLEPETTDNYLGGAFVITNSGSSKNVTSITIREQGTVDGSTDLDNIKLFYESDTSSPYDCASESYGGTETQYGSTDTDGFSAADGTSAFTGSVAITSTSTMCVYVVLDVTASPSNSETIEIDISNPSTQVVLSSGTASPATAVAISGSTTISTPVIDDYEGYWDFDECTGTTANDSSTNNYDGTISAESSGQTSVGDCTTNANTMWYNGRNGKIEGSLNFDGVDDRVTTAAALDQLFTSSTGSMSVWAKPTGTAPTHTGADNLQTIMGDVGQFAMITRGIIGGEDRIWAFNYDGSGDKVGITYTNDEWIHVVWVHDGGTLSVYKNGEFVDSVSSGNTSSMTGELYMGYNTWSSNPNFEGQIDDVRVYNKALSSSEITDLYELGTPEVVISVSITTDKSISYGVLDFGETEDTVTLTDTQTARNDSNITADLNIKTSDATGGTGWTLGSSAGSNIFVHEFSTNSGSNWTKFTTTDTYQTLATGVAVSGTQNFDLRITAPNPSSDGAQKSITITVQAVEPP